VHRSWQNCAADNDGMAGSLVLESLSNLLANTTNEAKVEVATGLTWRSDADKGQFCIADGFRRVSSRAQPSRFHIIGDDVPDLLFDNWGVALIDQVNLHLQRIDPNHLMPVMGEATRRDRAHIAQSENADLQNVVLSRAFMLSKVSIIVVDKQSLILNLRVKEKAVQKFQCQQFMYGRRVVSRTLKMPFDSGFHHLLL
jgi:hypothetical protein